MQSRAFERSAGYTAVLAGIVGFLYSVSFVLISRSNSTLGGALAATFLLAGGVLSIQALAAVYRTLREVDPGFALVGFMFGFAGALGAAIHGAWDLANVAHPVASPLGELPFAADPRGVLTFGFAGIAMLVIARLVQRGATLPRGLGAILPRGLAMLGYVSGVLLILTYLGRLIVYDASSLLILVPAGLEGFIVNPIWYVWLGVALLRGQRA